VATTDGSLEVAVIPPKVVGSESAVAALDSADMVLEKFEIDVDADWMFVCSVCSAVRGCDSSETRLVTRVLVSIPPNPSAARLL
jgi:hypothetical protein